MWQRQDGLCTWLWTACTAAPELHPLVVLNFLFLLSGMGCLPLRFWYRRPDIGRLVLHEEMHNYIIDYF